MSTDQSPASGKEKGRALVRGQACQGCYTRKVKCSGEKPVCARCEKSGRQCVYVPLETTRVETMRKKIAQHDAKVYGQLEEPRVEDVGGSSMPGWGGPPNAAHTSPNEHNFNQPPSQMQSFPSPNIPFGMHDGSLAAGPSSGQYHSHLPFLEQYHSIPPAPDRTHSDRYAPSTTDGLRPNPNGRNDSLSSSQNSTPHETSRDGDVDMQTESRQPEVDIPTDIQNHLISLFFERQRLFGVEMHQGRFYSRLYGNREDTVAPCLLSAMSLMACKYSSQPHVQQLEERIYQQAKSRVLVLDTTRGGTLLDNIRAALMLAAYEFYRGKVARAFSTYSAALGLGKAMGLHHVKSTKLEHAGRTRSIPYFQRIRLYYGDSPKDNIELGEWIWTFWDLYVVDACVSIGHEYEPGLVDSTIETPLPRPMTEYEALGSTHSPDQYLPSIFAFDNTASDTLELDAVVRIKAIASLKAAAAMRWLDPEPATSHLDTVISPKYCNPTACSVVQAGIDHVERAYLRLRSMRLVGGNTASDALIVLAMGLARIDCCDVRTTGASNDEALGIARSLIAQPLLLEQRHATDSLIPFFVAIFTRLSYIFTKEIDRLRRVGDLESASSVLAEVSVVMNALSNLGQMNDFSLAVNEAEGVTEELIESITKIII